MTNTETFTVAGRGDFPFDMLRHDRAFPADTISALNMGRQALRSVSLRTDRLRCVTPARWSSFGWTVMLDGFDDYAEMHRETVRMDRLFRLAESGYTEANS